MGLLVVISSPSGGGKDAVINALLKLLPRCARFTTTTSRPPRPGNINGRDYYFISKEEFEKKIVSGELIEHNFYAGNYYGTEKSHLKEALSKNDIVFTQIEVNGKHNLDKLGIPHLSIFLVPESLEILRHRIEKRGGVDPEAITERLRIAKQEIEASHDYDYRITNVEGKLQETIDSIAKIIEKHLKIGLPIDKKGQTS